MSKTHLLALVSSIAGDESLPLTSTRCCSSTGKNTSLKQLPATSELYCYQITEGTLYPQDSVKDLGVLITADLRWTPHIL